MTNKLVGKKIIPRKNVFSTKQDLSAKLTLTNMQLRNLILNLHNTLIFTIGRQKKQLIVTVTLNFMDTLTNLVLILINFTALWQTPQSHSLMRCWSQ